ncbi:hypothetical protein [Reyranella soli]|uniref:hypothetical protein n=1 Tax=Reyranella soli TaxID=1230389 RepID=UPI0011BD5993|nr:hypothetical protein [Reyranella soli]
MSTFDGIDVTAAFHAVANQIVVAKRQPTAWEAGCLYAARCELAIGREMNARRRIRLALLPGPHQELPVSIIPLPMTEELLQALALISTLNPISPRGEQDSATSADEGPARPRAD